MPYSADILNGEWRKEWQNMPEFELEDMRPFHTVNIHFANLEDVEEFGKLIGQKITKKKKYYWYSKREPKQGTQKIYIDEDEWVEPARLFEED